LFLLSLAAFVFTLQLRGAKQVQVLPSSQSGGVRPASLPATNIDDWPFSNPLEGKTNTLKQLDREKLDRAYRLGATARQER
jgi:hypothetical protein